MALCCMRLKKIIETKKIIIKKIFGMYYLHKKYSTKCKKIVNYQID